MQKSELAINQIRQFASNADISSLHLDLSSLLSVTHCAKKIIKQVYKIDIFINNAGVMWCPRLLTIDVNEMQLATNHLGLSKFEIFSKSYEK